MNRLIYGLNKESGGDIHIWGGADPAHGESPAASLSRFITVTTKNNANSMSLKEKIGNIFFRANEFSRAYYMEDTTKALFNKCLRLFFFFQKRDAYETMMMHDYGFY